MTEQEILNFKIGLSGTSLNKQPLFKICVNDVEYVNRTLSKPPNETEYFEFNATVSEGECNLTIIFLNKQNVDTIKNHQGTIISDFLLNIDSIEIDDIDIGSLKWSLSDYQPEYPEEYIQTQRNLGIDLQKSIRNCVNLGWNGRWILSFHCPFYIWLLENI